MICEGLSSVEIADDVLIKKMTVSNNEKDYAKTGVTDPGNHKPTKDIFDSRRPE